jgi:DNA-binding protein HU-beta
MAGKQLTKAQIIATLADKTGLSKKEIANLMQAQMDLAYKEAKNGFVIAGVGKLVVVARKARKGRNPATGETIMIPAKRVLKFRVAKAAKDSISLK